MKIYLVVRYEDVEFINPLTNDEDVVTTTTIIQAHGTHQDANFEAKWLRGKNELSNVTYDVEETELD